MQWWKNKLREDQQICQIITEVKVFKRLMKGEEEIHIIAIKKNINIDYIFYMSSYFRI